MKKIVIFGGTSEGRLLAKYCDENFIPAIVCVATEYGTELLEEYKNIHNQQNAETSTYAVSDETKDFICSVVVNM